MSKLRTIFAVSAAAATLGAGMLAGGTPKAQAETVICMPAKANIHCSMYWANRVTAATAMTGKDRYSVVNMQRSLTQVGLPTAVTGAYNTQTQANLIKYQRSRNIPATGRIDYKTIVWLRAGAGVKVAGYITPVSTVAKSSSTKAQQSVKFAYAQIGKPYGYGATGPNAYDCSGLTGAAWKSAGVSVPRTSYAQLGGLRTVSKSQLQPGDLVGFYSGGHIGIYVGNGYVIHSSRPGKPVSKVPMSQMPFYKAVRPAG